MSFTPRLLALDVDGTLVNNANEMSAGVRDAVRAAADAGLHVVISTGRSLPGVMDAARKLDIGDSLAVASNGAVVFGHDPIEILHTVTFDSREAVKLLLEHVPDAAVAVEEIGIGYRINKPFPDGEINGRMTVQTIDELVADPVTRVIIRSPESSAEEFAEMAHSLGLVGTNYFVGYTAWLDLAPDGVSKASGLQVVTDRLGLSAAEVLAIGDGDNDVEMLKWAGRGVAMGQAPIAVQDVADTVTETVDNDGVALEISQYL